MHRNQQRQCLKASGGRNPTGCAWHSGSTSAATVRTAVVRRLQEGRQMDRHYDHPILLLQHMIWHEGYHHGQIKLTLKLAGQALADEAIGAGTWDVWMDKT